MVGKGEGGTVSMGFWVGNRSNISTEKCVRLQLYLLVATLGCHGFGLLINSAAFVDMREATSNMGCMSSLLIRLGLPQKGCQLVCV